MKWIRPVLFCGLLTFFVDSGFSQGLVNATIRLDRNDKAVTVSPDRIEIDVGERIRWLSSGNAEDRIDIEIEDKDGVQGPFPARNDAENPTRGRYAKKVGSPIVTEVASNRGDWKYSIVWTFADGREIRLDPRIIVK